jgi:hypothetical protein
MVSGRSKVASSVTSPFTKISHAMATMKISSSMNPLVTRLGRAPTVHLCQEPWRLASAVEPWIQRLDEPRDDSRVPSASAGTKQQSSVGVSDQVPTGGCD